MSISAYIDVKIVSSDLRNINSVDILRCFQNFWWNLNDNGQMSYLPLEDNGMFNWKSEDIDEQKIYSLIEMKDKSKELIGITITWQNTGIGVALLISDSSELSFILSINRNKCVVEGIEVVTDFTWYLERLIIPLKNNNYIVNSIECNETI